jgi:hypothetical protein
MLSRYGYEMTVVISLTLQHESKLHNSSPYTLSFILNSTCESEILAVFPPAILSRVYLGDVLVKHTLLRNLCMNMYSRFVEFNEIDSRDC